ncbi:MAG: hypothetical protein DIZ80_06985 [endosymbiont of Galathealinum brachiosum]|uniref:Solute-binding protein family 3/N-terminal domain-containing protein n=1 Tax=endosymbiont of Galathealinum brachiosum TaxID=2200906 RepID=A0A370DGB2_9GAMM|nr:MAG: hypothetical protein DIZ80_06985 [endosymbiont of Galathealinum brachiosum]
MLSIMSIFKNVSVTSLRLIILCLFFNQSSYAATHLTFCMDEKDVFPWSLPSTQDGLNLVLLNMVDKELADIHINYISMPWNDCFIQLKHNKVDGVFQASYVESRKKFGAYSKDENTEDSKNALHIDSYSLYTLKDSSVNYDGKTITGLNKKPIATNKGYSIFEDLQSKKLPVYGHNSSTIKQFRIMMNGKFSAVASLTFDGDYLLNQPEFSDKIIKIKPALSNKHYYLMLSNQLVDKQPELADKIWNEIQRIRASQEYQNEMTGWWIKNRLKH